MRKLLLLSLALTVLMSCKKDDETGIPPIDGQQKQSSVLDAKTATINDYKDGKKVSLKGNITVKGTYSYIIFSDKTEVQIFAHKSIVENFSQETKKKLATQGQEVTVTGTFKDHKLKNGTVIKEILYEKESDLVFGSSSVTPPANDTVTELDAKTATVNDYKDGKKVSLKGNITIKGTYSYIIFSDKTEVQIFAHKSIVDNFSQETKKKLATQGQEVTVTGTFKDYKLKNGTVIKEILYEKEEDLVFGSSSVTPPANDTVTELDAKTATVNDYVEDKKVKLKGVVSVKNSRTYLNFSDGTEIQVYVTGYTKLDQSIKTKLNTAGQELTATGTFKTHNNTRQIQIASGSDLVFGNVVTQDNNNQGGSQNGNQGGGNQSGNTTPNVFDFESITPSNHYNETGTLIGADGVTLTYKARTDVENYGIKGKGLIISGNNHKNSFIKVTFPKGVKEISFDYNPAFNSKKNRHILIYEGEDTSNKLDEISFSAAGKYTKTLNKNSSYTILIKASLSSYQFVIDNFSWK